MSRLALVAALAFALAACSLAEDITPPPGSRHDPLTTLPPATPIVATPPATAETGLDDPIKDPADSTAEPIEGTITVKGTVVNGTAGGSVPAGLEVTLHGFDGMSEAAALTATTDGTGAYTFESVPVVPGRQFVAVVTYGGMIYGSENFAPEAGQSEYELPLQVYETSDDTSGIRIERIHLFFEFSPGQVIVGELFIVSNDGDTTAVDPAGTLRIPIPAGATELAVQGAEEGSDYTVTAEGLADLRAIRPGQGSAQILFSYRLPYDRGLDLEQEVPYPVAVANVLMPDVGVEVKGDGLQELEAQSIQGTDYRNYSLLGLQAGDTLALQLSGKPKDAASSTTTVDPAGIAVGVGALGLALVGIGAWWYRRPARKSDDGPVGSSRTDALIQAIADLDDAFDAGEIEAREHQRQRAKLKSKLVRLMEEEGG